MYRIICESYNNFKNDFTCNNYRKDIMEPFELLVDIEKYKKEKKDKTYNYKRLEDLIYYIKKSIDNYPNLKAFLWTIESRGIIGKHFEVTQENDLKEQVKILNMFLKLAYWE